MDQRQVKGYVNNHGCEWIFNPPPPAYICYTNRCRWTSTAVTLYAFDYTDTPTWPATWPPDVYVRRYWRRVQNLADQFWIRGRREYLQSMQTRTKWDEPKRNLHTGDVVLAKEEGARRNDWPINRVSEAIESDDGRVRKAQVETVKGGAKMFLWPIRELVLLVPAPAEQFP